MAPPFLVTFTIAITVAAYLGSRWLFLRFKSPLLNPVLVSTLVVVAILLACGLHFGDYQAGKDLMTFPLGPATVALALPLYRNRSKLLGSALPILGGVVAGSLTSMAVVLWDGRLAGLPPDILSSLAAKSVTAPIAAEIARLAGGDPSLAVAFVVATGMIGAILGPPLLTWLRVTQPIARGLALGVTAHGQGTAIALFEGHTQGAMAGIAMALNAVFTSFFAPFLIPLLLGR